MLSDIRTYTIRAKKDISKPGNGEIVPGSLLPSSFCPSVTGFTENFGSKNGLSHNTSKFCFNMPAARSFMCPLPTK